MKSAREWTGRRPGERSEHGKSEAVDCGDEGGENSPIYHELDPVVVASEPPLSSFHAYQSIVDVQRQVVELRSSGSADSFDTAATSSPSCSDVTGHVTTPPNSGSKWTLFSRLRLPRRTTATSRQQRGHVTSASGRSPPRSTPAVSGSRGTPPSCQQLTSRPEENVARADYFYLSTAAVRRHFLSPVAAGSPPRDAVRRESTEHSDGETRKRGRRRVVNSLPFSSPCCGVRMAEIRAAWRIQSCGPRIVSDVIVPTYVSQSC